MSTEQTDNSIDSNEIQSTEFVQLSTVNDELFIILKENEKYNAYQTDIDAIVSGFGKDTFRKLYPNIVCDQHEYYLVSENQSHKIKLDINNEPQLEKLGILPIQLRSFDQNVSIPHDKLIPEEMRNDYCLIWGGQVMFHTKDLDKFTAFKDKTPLCFTEYHPQKINS